MLPVPSWLAQPALRLRDIPEAIMLYLVGRLLRSGGLNLVS